MNAKGWYTPVIFAYISLLFPERAQDDIHMSSTLHKPGATSGMNLMYVMRLNASYMGMSNLSLHVYLTLLTKQIPPARVSFRGHLIGL